MAAQTQAAAFPSRGVVVPGKTIGGVALGMTEAQVRKIWGNNFIVCTSCGKLTTWLYEYQGGEPLGAAIKFDIPASTTAPSTTGKSGKGGTKSAAAAAAAATAAANNAKVVAVFTLGSPADWGVKGVMMGDPVSNVYNLYGNTGDENCIGYSALTVNINGAVTSFYSASGVIYGYALTAASQSPCQ